MFVHNELQISYMIFVVKYAHADFSLIVSVVVVWRRAWEMSCTWIPWANRWQFKVCISMWWLCCFLLFDSQLLDWLLLFLRGWYRFRFAHRTQRSLKTVIIQNAPVSLSLGFRPRVINGWGFIGFLELLDLEILLFADDAQEVLSLCICILTFPLYFFLKSFEWKAIFSSVGFSEERGVFRQISTEEFFVLLCRILLCR